MRHLSLRYYLPSWLSATGSMMLVPTLPLYLNGETESLALVSIVLTAAALGGLLANVPSGGFVQRYGEWRGFVGGMVLSGIGLVALAMSRGLVLPFVACLVAGAGQSARLLARQSYARRILGPNVRGRLLSVYGGLGRVSLLIGPLLGGFLGEAIGMRGAFGVAAALMASGVGAALLAGRGPYGGPGVAVQLRLWRNTVDTVRNHGRIIGLVGVGQLGGSVIRAGRLVLIPLYAEGIGLDLSDIGVTVAIASGLDLLFFPVAGWIMDRFGRLYAIVPSFTIMSAGLAVLPLADSFLGVSLAALLIGFGNGIGSGTMLTFSADLAPADNPAGFLGVLRLLSDFGRMIGPLAVGFVAATANLGVSSLVLAAVGIATALLFTFAIGEPEPVAAVAGE